MGGVPLVELLGGGQVEAGDVDLVLEDLLDQARGLSQWNHGGRTVPLNVSAGIGHSIYSPVRFACRPEATLLTLLPR